MAYDNDIPKPNDRLKDSQPDLRSNFMELYTFLNVNHEIFASPAGQGKHKFLTMPRQNPAPAAPTGTDGLFYAGLGTVSNNTELFWRRSTAGTLRSLTEGSINNPGWSMTPSGLMLKWANNIDATGLADIDTSLSPFPHVGGIGLENGPDFAGIVCVMITISDQTAGDVNRFVRVVNLNQPNGHSFQVYSSQRTQTIVALSTFSALVLGTRA